MSDLVWFEVKSAKGGVLKCPSCKEHCDSLYFLHEDRYFEAKDLIEEKALCSECSLYGDGTETILIMFGDPAGSVLYSTTLRFNPGSEYEYEEAEYWWAKDQDHAESLVLADIFERGFRFTGDGYEMPLDWQIIDDFIRVDEVEFLRTKNGPVAQISYKRSK